MRYKFKALICGDDMTTIVEGRAVGQTRQAAENKARSGLAKQFNAYSSDIELELTEL